jgi:tetratricopeptide (TPR) repeat protein
MRRSAWLDWFRLHPASPARARAFLLAAAFIPLLLGGCELAQKQEQFHQFNNDGIDLYKKGSYGEALEDFQFALKFGPQDPNLLFNIGQCYDRLNQPDKAETYYKQCLAASVNHAECRHALAALMYRTGRSAEADAMIQDWLAAEPKLAAAYADDGWRLRLSGDTERARARFWQALHLDSHNVRALTELGILHEDQLRPDLALPLYKLALQYDPDNSELKININRLMANKTSKPLPD